AESDIPLDLGPAARRLADLVARIPDEDLTRPTPCPAYALGDLIDHVGGLAIAFAAAARKERSGRAGRGASGGAARRGRGWRRGLARARPPGPRDPGAGLAGARSLAGDDEDRRVGQPGADGRPDPGRRARGPRLGRGPRVRAALHLRARRAGGRASVPGDVRQ